MIRKVSLTVFCSIVLAISCVVAGGTSHDIADGVSEILGVELVREVTNPYWTEEWTRVPSFSPSGKSLLVPTGGRPSTYTLLDMESWEIRILGEFAYPELRPIWLDDLTIAVPNDATVLVISLSDGMDVSGQVEGPPLDVLTHPAVVSNPFTGEGGLYVKKGRDVIKEWKEVKSVHNPRISPSGRYMSFGAYFPDYDEHPEKYPGRQGLFLWDRNSDELMIVADHISEEAAFSSDERWLLYAFQQLGMGGGITEEGTPDGSLWIMDLETGARKQLLPLEVFPIINLAWDGHDLFCLTRDPTTLSFYRLKLKAKNEQ